jgi:predicted ATPase/DNA-binding SARP family transcriptional activator
VAVALTLLEDVRWRGATVAGDRSRALLAALAAGGGRPISDERLIELVWGEDAPANATKSLQVLVSRTRAACGADAIVREGSGYRLGVGPAEVDSGRLAALVADAAAALDRDPAHAQALAREALALASGLESSNGDDGALLAEIRQAAAAHADEARTVLARASGRLGAHADALPDLEAVHAADPDDESLLADLLRSEAVVRGPGAALERYERYRRGLRDRLGTSPGERLQRVHRDLLALDRPERTGVRYDATSLLGRDADIDALRGLIAGSRVVSIVGAGGLGKTRLAHVLARDATQPLVHVVELVGVTAAEDVVAEVGSVLGVRDSISSRRALTPEQRADLRGRIAERLARSPSLLVLDNCEHLVGAVAELVAFLISTTADLHVLTTSRAPLAIAAERVYLLGELEIDDAARLFDERAVAARPGAQLDDAVVRRIVTRLDGLPLAIELAAAKVRAMSVEEIDRRLENRFALLRGGDRSAPDRHQTLLAVIDWSWNLLDEDERRALRRLALFHDGFTLEAADAVLGGGALDAVQGLVDQSLLSVRDTPAGVRYRMLETVREFGRMQLVDAGEDADARAARRRWATACAERHGVRLFSPDQFAAIDAVGAEELNLADELRDAIADGDPGALVQLLHALGILWTVRGEHARLLALAAAIADTIDGWAPPPELEHAARVATAIALTSVIIVRDDRSGPIRELLVRLGPGQADPRIAGLVRMLLAYDPADPATFDARIERLAADPDPWVALPARQWLSHLRENAGDPLGAMEASESALALVDRNDGPWSPAILHTQIAQLAAHLGDRDRAAEHANAALPVMERLRARDDEVQLRSLLVVCAIADGRLADAEAELGRMDRIDDGEVFGAIAVERIGSAELALARGDRAAGLAAYRDCAERMRELRFPGVPATGLEPWVLFGEATALAAHAYHATGVDEAHGRDLFAACRERALRLLGADDPHLDCPVAGVGLFGVGAWGLLREAAPIDDAVALLVLAERFAYNRTVPTMAWERIAPHAEARAPGRIAEVRAGYGEDPPRALLGEACELLARLA